MEIQTASPIAFRHSDIFSPAPPAGGSADRLVGYLSNYTQHTAISDHRIESVSAESVTFRYKDYQDHQLTKRMTLKPEEFIRRFLMHLLPCGLVRVRHYGLFANGQTQRREECRALFPVPSSTIPVIETLLAPTAPASEPDEPIICPQCQLGRLVWIDLPRPHSHAPPSCLFPSLAA